jgi:EcsC protein family
MKRVLPDGVYRALRMASHMGFRRAYKQVQVNPQKYFEHVKDKLGLPIESWDDLRYVSDEDLKSHADRVINSAARIAALEGMGLGLGGLVTALPDFGILAAITIRMLQRLSLTYGFQYSTNEELASLWLAAASAAGLDFSRDFLEKQATERLLPKIVDQVALKAGAEVADKWAARVVPILSAAAGSGLNYWFVRSWGRRAQRHFLERRELLRLRPEGSGPRLLPSESPS